MRSRCVPVEEHGRQLSGVEATDKAEPCRSMQPAGKELLNAAHTKRNGIELARRQPCKSQ